MDNRRPVKTRTNPKTGKEEFCYEGDTVWQTSQ